MAKACSHTRTYALTKSHLGNRNALLTSIFKS